MFWYKAQLDKDDEHFAPSENSANFGTTNVDIQGSEPHIFADIPGVQGSINLTVSVREIKTALEGAFGGNYFAPITNIKIQPLPGKFGQTVSTEPHTIYINEQAMIDAVREGVSKEVMQTRKTGQEAVFTPEIGRRINTEIAKLLWETIPHERQHALDFQNVLKKIDQSGTGSVSDVQESAGDAAGKSALNNFKWYSE